MAACTGRRILDGEMPKQDGKAVHSVVIAGGGVAALEAALALRAHGEDRVHVELLAPEPRFWYRPSSVGVPFGQSRVPGFDLPDLVARAGATFTPGELAAVDRRNRVATTSWHSTRCCWRAARAPSLRFPERSPSEGRPTPKRSRDCSASSSAVRRDASSSPSHPARRGRCRCTSSRC
jgi:hypothetical protein